MHFRLAGAWRLWIVLALVLLNALVAWATRGFYETRWPLTPGVMRPTDGHGYVVSIRHPVVFLHPVFDSQDAPRRAPTRVYEDGTPLGPPHAPQEAIETEGGGRYLHLRAGLYFSSSDGSDPRRNGRDYAADMVMALRPQVLPLVFFPSLVIGLALCFPQLFVALWRPVAWLQERSPAVRWIMVNVAPGLAITLVLLAVIAVGAEIVARVRIPFLHHSWPGRYDPEVGTTFVPGATLKWTNKTDFWAVAHINSLGFPDREPPRDKPPGTCRVAIIGDSFVEAAQVPIEDKVQVRFERLASERLPGLQIDTVAFGYSGTGQANQLPYYDMFARELEPDAVVLVLASNDFANNSSVLEGIRYGWHPLHPPRLFFRRDTGGELVPVPIDPEWRQRVLELAPLTANAEPAELPEVGWLPGLVARMRRLTSGPVAFLQERSYAYNWLSAHVSAQYPQLVHTLRGPARARHNIYVRRMEAIERLDGFADVFRGWEFPEDVGFDEMFHAESMPPLFEETEAVTGLILDEWRARGERDGFSLIALATYGLSNRYEPGYTKFGRHLVSRGYYLRFERLLRQRGIPVIEQRAYIERQGGDVSDAHFHRDAHWSPQGHQWAAEALLEYFAAHPEVCPSQQTVHTGAAG